MKFWQILTLISIGGTIDLLFSPYRGFPGWPWLLAAGLIGWQWPRLIQMAQAARTRLVTALTGQTPAAPATDTTAMASELAALSTQMAQLRETATSFDVSFGQTLKCLDERLRRVEQQSNYIQTNQA